LYIEIFIGSYSPRNYRNTSKSNLILETVIYLNTFLVLNAFLLMSILLIQDPRGAIFIGALVPEMHFIFPIRVAIILYHLYIMAYFHLGCLAITDTFFTFIFRTIPIYIRELRIGQNQNTYKLNNSIRTAANIRHAYRSLQILVAICILLSWSFSNYISSDVYVGSCTHQRCKVCPTYITHLGHVTWL